MAMYMKDSDGNVQGVGFVSELYTPKGYRHIETITLEEDVKILSRRAEPNGKTYNFKELLFLIKNVAGNTGNAYINVFDSDGISTYRYAYYGLNYSTVYARMVVHGGFIFLECHSGANDYNNFQGYSKPVQSDRITRVSIQGNGTLKAGTVFEIYAIDA